MVTLGYENNFISISVNDVFMGVTLISFQALCAADTVEVVSALPPNNLSDKEEYNASLSFPSERLALVSDGKGCLTLFETGDRKLKSPWKVCMNLLCHYPSDLANMLTLWTLTDLQPFTLMGWGLPTVARLVVTSQKCGTWVSDLRSQRVVMLGKSFVLWCCLPFSSTRKQLTLGLYWLRCSMFLFIALQNMPISVSYIYYIKRDVWKVCQGNSSACSESPHKTTTHLSVVNNTIIIVSWAQTSCFYL